MLFRSSTRVKPTARAHLYSTRRWVDSYVREEPEGAVVSVAPGVVVTASGAPFARFIDPATVPLIKDHGDTVRIRLTTAWGSLEGDVTCPGRTTGASQCSP